MSLFQFRIEEILTFFAVLVRLSVLFSILPFFGDRVIPVPVKILLALCVSVVLFPSLIMSKQVSSRDALYWGRTASGISLTLAAETATALILGFVSKLLFDGISFGANLVGNFMGFASASTYDPHQESHTEVVAQFQTVLGMLVFVALDGHHLLLSAVFQSYHLVGLGQFQMTSAAMERLIQFTGEVIRFGIQLSAPVALSLFAVNIVLGMIAKAIPQLNVLSLSFSVTALIGFLVIWLGFSDFQGILGVWLGRCSDWMLGILQAIQIGKGR